MNWQFQSFEMSAKFHLYPVAKGAIWLAEYVSVKLKNDEQMVLIIWDVSKIPFVSFRESCDVIGSARKFLMKQNTPKYPCLNVPYGLKVTTDRRKISL